MHVGHEGHVGHVAARKAAARAAVARQPTRGARSLLLSFDRCWSC